MDEVRYEGVIEKVFRAEKDGMCRFTLATHQTVSDRNRYGEIECRYIASRVREGLPVTVTGSWKGSVLEAGSVRKRYNKKEVYNYLVKYCRKIGKVAAENTVDALGARIFSLDEEGLRQRLTDIGFDKHLTAAQMDEICTKLSADDENLCELQDYIACAGGEMAACTRLYEAKGADALGYLKKEPYMCCMAFGLGFACSDRVAKMNGVSGDVPERLEALIWTMLTDAKDNGHSYLPLSVLTENVNRISGEDDANRKYTSLKILTQAEKSKRYSAESGNIYLAPLRDDEEACASMLAALSRAESKYRQVADADIDAVEKKYGIAYAPEQRKAFAAAGHPGVSMIIGGPGTGKTTIMKGIAEAFETNNPGKSIVLCAPTGRAAKRLAEATGREASTVHSTLNYIPYTNVEELHNMHTRDNPIDASLVILDEFSMMSLPLFRLFLDAIRPGTSVILVGDKNQLPSVEVGNVLSDLMSSGCFPVYELSANYRQAGAGSLEEGCGRILEGKMPESCSGVDLIRSAGPEESLGHMEAWFFMRYDKRDPFGVQILSPSYKGAAGINSVNDALREEPAAGYRVGKGDKVIFTRTSQDPESDDGYINGDMGIITEIGKGSVRMKRDWDGASVTYPDSVLEDIQHAYDMSVHRSQGSEFKDVLVYLPAKPKNMLKRNLLYTAVTRAKQSVTILYEGTSLEDAVSDPSALERYSGLASRIRKRFGR